MNIALLGYGHMGKEIERLARERHMNVKHIFTIENNLRGTGLSATSLRDVDVCIDFSTATAFLTNIEILAEFGMTVVVGTTGWYDKLEHVRNLVARRNTGLLYAPNFSIGMNLFANVVASASHLINAFDQYDVAIHETHHRGKGDSPSGTALLLGQTILQQIRWKKEMLTETAHQPLRTEELHITSSRVGHVVGEHTVRFDSEADTMEFVHRAKNRIGFALGALIAAEWMKGKHGMYTMKDIINSL